VRLAAGLSLAAAPTFAVMAAVTAALDARAGVALCGPAPTPVSGMVVMYVLMSAFHLGPWLQRAPR
jgi:hypothetical protein